MPGICVLLVDDSLLFREMMAQELLRYLPEGSRVEKAADPFEARDKILDCAPDVMLLDIEMPKMDGLHLTKRLREDDRYAELPIIVFSSLISDDLRHKGESVGVNAQITKPEIGRLIETVDSYVL